jgi:hypothetical protein
VGNNEEEKDDDDVDDDDEDGVDTKEIGDFTDGGGGETNDGGGRGIKDACRDVIRVGGG